QQEDIMLIKSLSATAAAAVLTLAPMAPAGAETLTFDAGIACAFPLQIDSTGSRQVTKTCEAPDGPVRILNAGRGADLVFTNLDTEATYSLAGNGAVRWIRVNADDSARITLTGHNILIYFPTDTPAGPSTTLVVGREDIAVDEAGNFTRLSQTGTTTDICATLSSRHRRTSPPA